MDHIVQTQMPTYLLSHAERFRNIADPGHTPLGLERLKEMNGFLRDILHWASNFFVVSGDGLRFRELARYACGDFGAEANIISLCTPFLGGPTADRDDKSRDLACGDFVPGEEWLGIASGVLDPWAFIAHLALRAKEKKCDVLLMCGGGEFTSAILKSLKIKNKDFPKSQGSVYSVHAHPRAIFKAFNNASA